MTEATRPGGDRLLVPVSGPRPWAEGREERTFWSYRNGALARHDCWREPHMFRGSLRRPGTTTNVWIANGSGWDVLYEEDLAASPEEALDRRVAQLRTLVARYQAELEKVETERWGHTTSSAG